MKLLAVSLVPGLKFKIAHKRADSEKWSATLRTQRKRMIMFLRSVLADLERQNDREGALTTVRETLGYRNVLQLGGAN